MVIKSMIAARWVLENQHKFKQVVRFCHMRAVQPRLDTEDYQVPIETENYGRQLNRQQKKPHIPHVPQDLSTKKYLLDQTYRFHEVLDHPQRSFKFDDLEVRLAGPDVLKPKPDAENLQFGKYFTDHMLKIYYHKALGGWQRPEIVPFENIALHPAAKVLHYAVECFEGMKAFRGADGRIRMFRPILNMERLNASAVRSGLPSFDNEELARCITRLISIDQDWVPHTEAASLYIRPTFIGIDGTLGVASSDSALLYTIISPVGAYFSGGVRSVSLLADPHFTRAWNGGCGDRKMGSNYGPTLNAQAQAMKKGHQQLLWLHGENHDITEVGTMNIFVYYINDEGDRELLTPSLNGLILPGITRHSLLQMARDWNDFKVVEKSINMKRLRQLLNENRVIEMFGAGTACVISPIDTIEYLGEHLQIPTMEQANPVHNRFYETLTGIQYGKIDHPWADVVD